MLEVTVAFMPANIRSSQQATGRDLSSHELNMAKKKKKKKSNGGKKSAVAVAERPTPVAVAESEVGLESTTSEPGPVEVEPVAKIEEPAEVVSTAVVEPVQDEAALAAKYAAIEDVGERAFAILVDLGTVRGSK